MQSRRAHISLLLSAGAIGGLGGWARAVHAMLKEEEASDGFYLVRGDVRLNGAPARLGQAVAAGDTVTTGADGKAIYVIGRDAYLQRAASEASFASDGAVSLFRIVTGALLAVFGPGERRLQTPTSTIGIRGTACYLEAEPTRTYACLCYGRAELVPIADPSHAVVIETRHHDHPLYINNAPGMPMMVDGEVVNHTDDELDMLEALCGRRPPFTAGMMRKG